MSGELADSKTMSEFGPKLLNAFGQGLAGLGGYQASQGYARYNATSAKAAQAAALEAPKVAQWQETRLRMSKRAILSNQRFVAARAGVVFEGTPVDVANLTEENIELDAMNIYREGQIEKKSYEMQAQAFKKAEKANKRSGAMGLISGGLGVVGAFL